MVKTYKKPRFAKFNTLQDCIQTNTGIEDDPRQYCIMKFPELADQELNAALVSTTNQSTDVKPMLCKKGGDLSACRPEALKPAIAKLKIARLKIKAANIRLAAEGDASTSQSSGSPDGPHFTLKKIKRTGFPEGRGTKEQVGMLLASQDSKYARYYLIDSQDINGNGWGVTEASIEKNIKSFVNMPFVITAQDWIPNSPYERQYDHPFIPSNDLRQIFAHQEVFRVGSIVKVAKQEDNGKWYAMIKINPKFAHMSLPPFCSPAIYQIDPHEPDGNITQWIGLHLAGLMSDPAYGPRVAILKGSCIGNGSACSHQFKMAKMEAIKPVEQVDQSGLDITETDKAASPFDEKKEKEKIASCVCPDRTASLNKRLLPLMSISQKIAKLREKQARIKIAIEQRRTVPPIPLANDEFEELQE